MKSRRDAGINTKDWCGIKQNRKMDKKRNQCGRKNRDENDIKSSNRFNNGPE